MEDGLNKQLNEELYSAYLYMAMAADFENKNLKGFANWMNVQVKEELTHALKIYNFIIERGGKVVLESLKKPSTTWKNSLTVFEEAYAHETYISSCIHNLVDLAYKLKDHPAASMLQWFVDEQVEEEDNTDEIVQRIKQMKNFPGAEYMLDQELAKRVFIDETAKGA